MLPFRKILFPVDYSESCQAIIPYVKEMTQHFSSELSLVHAYGLGALARSELARAGQDGGSVASVAFAHGFGSFSRFVYRPSPAGTRHAAAGD